MGSDGVFSKKKSGFSPPRKWSSSLLSEEVPLQTLADTTYVRVMSVSRDAEGFEHDVIKHGPTRWSWLKRPGRELRRETVPTGLAKSRSHNAWAWLRPPADEFQFDPTKRWPQGW